MDGITDYFFVSHVLRPMFLFASNCSSCQIFLPSRYRSKLIEFVSPFFICNNNCLKFIVSWRNTVILVLIRWQWWYTSWCKIDERRQGLSGQSTITFVCTVVMYSSSRRSIANNRHWSNYNYLKEPHLHLQIFYFLFDFGLFFLQVSAVSLISIINTSKSLVAIIILAKLATSPSSLTLKPWRTSS